MGCRLCVILPVLPTFWQPHQKNQGFVPKVGENTNKRIPTTTHQHTSQIIRIQVIFAILKMPYKTQPLKALKAKKQATKTLVADCTSYTLPPTIIKLNVMWSSQSSSYTRNHMFAQLLQPYMLIDTVQVLFRNTSRIRQESDLLSRRRIKILQGDLY